MDLMAQGDQFPPCVGHFNPYSGLAWNPFDENGFGLQSEAQVFGQSRDAAVFDSGLGLEFKCRDHRPRINLYYRPQDIELLKFGFDPNSRFL